MPPLANAWSLLVCLGAIASLPACVSHRLYNDEPGEYILELTESDAMPEPARADLAIVEFDDHGSFWLPQQIEDAVALIRTRNAEAQRGTLVVVYAHGWKNNADPSSDDGNLARIKRTLLANARAQQTPGIISCDRVVGVYLGWRGDSSNAPLLEQLTFWDRRRTAERVASLNMREAIFRVMHAAKENPDSKCIVVGHPMGGLIIGRTMAPSLTTLLLSSEGKAVNLPVDLVLLQNPALDALASWQFIDFLKRSGARLRLREPGGQEHDADGPLIASITSEADDATGVAYPLGRSLSSMTTAFRPDRAPGAPSQRHLATHAEGHVDYLVSHTARVEDGRVVLESVPDAFNDTPFWVIRVSRDISKDHGDVNNPIYGQLIEQLLDLNRVREPRVGTFLTTLRSSPAAETPVDSAPSTLAP